MERRVEFGLLDFGLGLDNIYRPGQERGRQGDSREGLSDDWNDRNVNMKHRRKKKHLRDSCSSDQRYFQYMY